VLTCLPAGGADAFYSYQSLPSKLWKKYLYAARFVNLVRAKTPKVTLYTSKVFLLIDRCDRFI
jgi:polo-like kinase 4